MIFRFQDYRGDVREECDVCVIGSGAGGAVAAKELAEKGFSVVVLEEGGYFTPQDWDSKPLSSLTRMWRDGGLTGSMGNPPVSITLGKCVGGTTAINSATCFRTPESVLAKWRGELGLIHLTNEYLDPLFKRVEKEIHVTTLPWEVLGACARIVKRGCDRLGLNCRPLRHNVKRCRGAGTCQFGCPGGRKQSTDISYIPKAVAVGARVYANCRAERILFKGGTAVGVSGSIVDPARDDRKVYSIEVRSRVVVAACGTLLTPQLLRRSGVRSPHLGRHLQVHPAGRVCALMREKVEGWKGVSQGAYIDDFHGQCIALEGIFIHPSVLLSALPGVGWEHKEMAVQFPHIAAFGVMVHDSSEGRVYPWMPSRLILSSYMIRKTDIEVFKKGIASLSLIFMAAGAIRIYTGISSFPVLETPDDAERLLSAKVKPNHFEILAFHPLGTCRMAANPRFGVVSPRGQVFGCRGLYVADGSVVPTSLGVNPQVTIMTLATHIAEGIALSLT